MAFSLNDVNLLIKRYGIQFQRQYNKRNYQWSVNQIHQLPSSQIKQMTSTRCSNISKSPNKSSDVWVVPEDKLKILIRIRPVLNEQQETEFVELDNQNTLLIKRPGNHTYMKFNNILPYYSTQKDIFNQLQQSVSQFLSGTNITIFAYGQTGAGKTYSIIGNYSSPNCSTSLSDGDKENIYHLLSSEERGILSRSLEMIMEAVEGSQGQKVWISFYEIYNQKIYDLYNKEGAGALEIRESKHGEISIPNLITIEITRIQEAIHYLMIGLKNRSTGSTHANAKSSRSHSIFQISMENNEGRTSSLRIVDLAGSEKFKIPSDLTALQKQIRIQQLTSINGSLSCLGHCISALIEKSRTHIPFRNSKLTRILSDSLLGQGKMRFIICISPSVSASAQTFSTLQFANRAKRAIFDRSEMRTPQMSKKKSESEEMVNLRKQLEKQRQLRLHYEEELGEIKKQNLILKIQNEKLKNRINQISSKAGEMSKSITNEKKSTFRSSSSRNGENYEQQNDDPALNENDSHEEMLNLPIFQKNRQLIPNQSSSSVSASRNKPINVKKAEFEKKIRKFIEQSSPQTRQRQNRISSFGKSQINLPSRGQDQSRPGAMKPISQNESFQKQRQMQRQQKRKQAQQRQTKDPRLSSINENKLQQQRQQQNANVFEQNEQQLDSLWQYHQQETQQFFEKACQKMNMKQYQDLKQQMQKAKSELLRFKLMDDQIEKKKVSVVR